MNTERISEKRWEDARMDLWEFYDAMERGQRAFDEASDDEREEFLDDLHSLEMRGWES